MTTAPPCLSESRRLLLAHLGSHGLDSAEVGIVGDTRHIGEGDSYHLGTPEQGSSGYSVGESSRDRNGLCGYASAIDIGEFSVTVAGKVHNLRTFSVWLVAECTAGAPDTRDIREVIYSPDGKAVRRWDRLKRRSTGDSTHLWHTHVSVFRDATKAGRGLVDVFRRYLTTIGLIESAEEADLTPEQDSILRSVHAAIFYGGPSCGTAVDPDNGRPAGNSAVNKLDAILERPASAPVTVDAASVAAALAASPTFIAAIVRAVNDDAARRLSS